jgi:hypothetical protein
MFHKFARGRASIYETFGLGPVNAYFAPATPLPFGLRTKTRAGKAVFQGWLDNSGGSGHLRAAIRLFNGFHCISHIMCYQ